jgi:hypothetical protein
VKEHDLSRAANLSPQKKNASFRVALLHGACQYLLTDLMPKIKTAMLVLTMSLCACHKPAPEFSLKGAWTANAGQITNCGNAAPVTLEQLSFVIQDARC